MLMKPSFLFFKWVLILLLPFSLQAQSSKSDSFKIKGLKASVEVIRDEWGVNHIYAKTNQTHFFYLKD